MTSPTVMTSRQRREASVKSVVAILERVVAKDSEFSPTTELKEALRSQGALARHADESLGIVAMSLNTQKVIADECCGGYEKLDALRIAAIGTLEAVQAKQAEPTRGTKDALQQEIDELIVRIALLEQDLGQLTWAFGRIVAYARSQAQEMNDPNALTRFKKELSAVESGLSLLRKPLGTNIIRGGFGG